MLTNRFSIGQFFGPVGLQGMSNTHPGEYLIPLYTQVGSPSGRPQVIAGGRSSMPRIDDRHSHLPPRIFRSAHQLKPKNLPNRQHGAPRMDDLSKVEKMLARFNKDVTDHDVDHQYQIVVKVVEHKPEVAAIQKKEKWYVQHLQGRQWGESTVYNHECRIDPSSKP